MSNGSSKYRLSLFTIQHFPSDPSTSARNRHYQFVETTESAEKSGLTLDFQRGVNLVESEEQLLGFYELLLPRDVSVWRRSETQRGVAVVNADKIGAAAESEGVRSRFPATKRGKDGENSARWMTRTEDG